MEGGVGGGAAKGDKPAGKVQLALALALGAHVRVALLAVVVGLVSAGRSEH